MKARSSLILILSMLLAATVFGGAEPTYANTPITVNTTEDSLGGTCTVAGGGTKCSLRAAIQTANMLPGPDTIVVPAGTYELTLLAPATAPGMLGAASVQNGDLDITSSLTIEGAGADQTIIAGTTGFNDRIFDIAAPADGPNEVLITGVTIRNGALVGDSGAGISNDATLTLRDVIVTGNTATVDITAGGDGGGIRNRGTLRVERSTLSGNQAGDDGGALYNTGTATLTTSTLSGNGASGDGGAINTTGTLRVEQSLLHSNTATVDGGAINNSSGQVALTNTTLTGNIAQRNGGAFATSTATGGLAPTTALSNTTLANNSASGNGENIRHQSGTLSLRATILTIEPASAGRNCSVDAASTARSDGYNVESLNYAGITTNSSCGLAAVTNDRVAQDASLAPLADNGGPTQTMALSPGSPALDIGPLCSFVDQRGYSRPADGNGDGTALCDSGAFEANARLLPNRVYLPLVTQSQ